MSFSGALIWPGVGHFLAGSYFLGLFWFTVALGLSLWCVQLVVQPQRIAELAAVFVAAVVVGLVQLIDAVRCAGATKKPMLHDPSLRLFAAAALLASALVWQHRVLSYLQDHVYELCYTPTPSMAPALQAGDRYLTLKDVPINRWDIVGFTAPPGLFPPDMAYLVKRVVGLPGDKVEVTDTGVKINDRLVDLPPGAGPYRAVDRWQQPLAAPSPQLAANGCWGRPIWLRAGEYFLLGDNTMESTDARFWPSINGHTQGAMPRDRITCKVVAICWPPERCRFFE